jgi:hypothetical protein
MALFGFVCGELYCTDLDNGEYGLADPGFGPLSVRQAHSAITRRRQRDLCAAVAQLAQQNADNRAVVRARLIERVNSGGGSICY